MNTKLAASSVTVRRDIQADAEELFDAWLDADSLAIWMCPGNVTHSVARLDARPGGRFEIEMHTPDAVLLHHGTYRTVERPHRLVFTWVSGGTQQTESLVTVDFHRTRGGTEIVLLHEQLPNDAAAHAHGMGWNRIVDLLLSLVEGRHRTTTTYQFKKGRPLMSSIVAINPFEVPAGMEDQALRLWDKLSAYFSKQPGYIGAKLHRSIDPNAKFHLITVAEWESADDFMKALSGEGLKTAAMGLEAFAHYPGLYQVVRT